MPRRKKGDQAPETQEKESGGSRLVTALIAIVIILIWLAVFAFLVKLREKRKKKIILIL